MVDDALSDWEDDSQCDDYPEPAESSQQVPCVPGKLIVTEDGSLHELDVLVPIEGDDKFKLAFVLAMADIELRNGGGN